MGNEQTLLQKHEFTLVKKIDERDLVKSKDGKQYLVQLFCRPRDLETLKELLKKMDHSHIVGHLTLEENSKLYVLTEYWEGMNLAQKVQALKEERKPSEQEKVMDWFLKICMALSHLHDNNIAHKNLRAQNVFFTDCGMVRLGMPAEITERASVHQRSDDKPPEVQKGATYNVKSDIWGLGCLLYELCMHKSAFTTEGLKKLGSFEPLPGRFSPKLQEMLTTMLQPEPEKRATVKEILWQPFTINCLVSQGRKAHAELKDCITNLKDLADGLERVHFRTTMGSLAGGVVGAAGGITSIVGLALAPFTMGASLIVTGIGVGVAVTGGAAAGVANITNMVSQSSDRQKVKNVITEFQEKMNFLVNCVKHISESQAKGGNRGFAQDRSNKMGEDLGAKVVRIGNIAGMAPVAAQALRLARVAEVAAGVFAGLFVAVDVFFVAMDAKELYNMWNKEDESVEFKSAVMKFVTSLRKETKELEKIVMELDVINI